MKPLEQTLLVSSIIIFSACEGDQLHQIKQELPSALWPLILLTLAWTTHRAVARRRLNRNLNLRYIKKSTTTPSTSLHGATVTTEHRLIIDLLELKLCWTCWDFEAATSREYDLRRSIDGKWQWKETSASFARNPPPQYDYRTGFLLSKTPDWNSRNPAGQSPLIDSNWEEMGELGLELEKHYRRFLTHFSADDSVTLINRYVLATLSHANARPRPPQSNSNEEAEAYARHWRSRAEGLTELIRTEAETVA